MNDIDDNILVSYGGYDNVHAIRFRGFLYTVKKKK